MKARVLFFAYGSGRSQAAAHAARLIGDDAAVELTALALLPGVPRGPLGLTRDQETSAVRVLAEIAADVARDTKRIFEGHGIRVETKAGVVETGGLPANIARFARDGRYDLVIMDAGEPRGIEGLAARSLAHAVARAVPCPVLLVKGSPGEVPASRRADAREIDSRAARQIT